MSKQHELMQFFKYDHLPEKLKETSMQFCILAERLVALSPEVLAPAGRQLIRELILTLEDEHPENTETRWALSRLKTASTFLAMGEPVTGEHQSRIDLLIRFVLEAKDCAVRALLYKAPEEDPLFVEALEEEE